MIIEVSLEASQVCLVDSNLIGGMREGILGWIGASSVGSGAAEAAIT